MACPRERFLRSVTAGDRWYESLRAVRLIRRWTVRWGRTESGDLAGGPEHVAGALINSLRGTDGSVVVDVRGEIDVTCSQRLCQVLVDAATRLRPAGLVVDL